ncbi:MAG: LysM peptidoglycan-binding domain-containing protein [Pseudomonadota bacterium]
MRVVIIFFLLIILGFIAWRAAQEFDLIDPAPEKSEAVTEEGADTAAADEPAAKSTLPSFDIVRVDRTGDLVIAGRAESGAEVRLYANGELLETTTAEANGDWTVFSEASLDAGAVELTLEMTTREGLIVRSDETVVIYVPENEGDKPLVLRTTPGGQTVILQDPRDPAPALGPLSIRSIDYDDSGTVIFAGTAEPDRIVRLFASGRLIDEARSDENGNWTIMATLSPGVYTLQAVQLDENGEPAFAIEIPFERARPEDIQLRDGSVIVQPGNSLWRIARRVYGSGFQYTVIYEANESQIRDPDLIYPGQIFSIPGEEENGPRDEPSSDETNDGG